MSTALAGLWFLVSMVPRWQNRQQGGNNQRSRAPPTWSVEGSQEYSFREWVQDITLWSMVSELTPARQAASIVMNLTGIARMFARTIPTDRLATGGPGVNGVQLDPVTYLIDRLRAQFADHEAEVRLSAMTEHMAFQRR